MRLHHVPIAALLALAAACNDPADDDTTLPLDDDAADDDTTADPCPADPSGGTGGATGTSWLTVLDHSTSDTAMPDREVLVHTPSSWDGASPLALYVMMTKPTPQDRAQVEEIFLEFVDQDAWSDASGFLFAVPMPGPYEGGNLGWYLGSVDDDAYFNAALDTLLASYNVDRSRIFLYGTSAGGRLAAYYGQKHGERLTGVIDHAGSSPWNQPPPLPWPRALPGLFIHDPADPIVSRQAMEDIVQIWEDAGAPAETAFDYASGHEWNGEEIQPLIDDWVGRTCP
jgi:poly(3-hydroxybutyrate) depolymerase